MILCENRLKITSRYVQAFLISLITTEPLMVEDLSKLDRYAEHVAYLKITRRNVFLTSPLIREI